MKAWIPLTLVFAFGLAAHAQATCTYPQSPAKPPNGSTASRDEMIAAKHDFDRYNGEMNVYLDCLNLEMDATPKDLSKLTLVQKHNAAVDELQAVVGKFNEQLKIFKAKQK